MAGSSNLASGIGSIAGSYNQAGALELQGEFQKQMADRNAKLATMQADDAVRRGGVSANNLRKSVTSIVGRQRAATAAGGVQVDRGSAASLQEQTQKVGALDAMTIENNAWREAWGYRMNAEISTNQGNFANATAKNSAGNTLLTGGLGFLADASKAAYFYGGGQGGNADYSKAFAGTGVA